MTRDHLVHIILLCLVCVIVIEALTMWWKAWHR